FIRPGRLAIGPIVASDAAAVNECNAPVQSSAREQELCQARDGQIVYYSVARLISAERRSQREPSAMPVHRIYNFADPVLRQKARPVGRIDKATQRLIDDMIETMRAAEGIGLAAPQIGVPERLFVAE